MNYRSVNDLSFLTSNYASRLPRDLDLIVGVSPGGMLVGSILSLKLNRPLIDLASFLRNKALEKGALVQPLDAHKVLLVDDLITGANALQAAIDQANTVFSGSLLTMAAYAEQVYAHQADVVLEVVELPRVFEWTIMHHDVLGHACLDIDGVLCVDPTEADNDDGDNYRRFLLSAEPLHIPTIEVAHLVTSRLEKYRKETEEWLAANGVKYRQLHMIDLPTAAERRRLKMHHKFKAKVYREQKDTCLFIESERRQAVDIMQLTGKPVFCIETNQMYTPGQDPDAELVKRRSATVGFKRKILNRARSLVSRAYPLAS